MKYRNLLLLGLISIVFLGCAKNLYKSAWEGDIQGMHESFNNGWGVNGRNPDGVLVPNSTTPLSLAVRRGNYDIVKLLIEKGADLKTDRNRYEVFNEWTHNKTGKSYGLLAISIAIADKRIIKILIDNDVPLDIDYTGYDGGYRNFVTKDASEGLARYAVKYYKEVQIRKVQNKQKEVESIKNDSIDILLGI